MSQTLPPPRSETLTAAQVRILEMALDITVSVGPSGVSTPAIAKRLGVSQPAIFKHFATKDALLQAMVGLVLSRMFAGLEQILNAHATSVRDKLKRMVFHQIAMFEEHPALLMIVFSPEMQINEGRVRDMIRTGMDRGNGILCGLIIEGQASGEFDPDIDPRTAAASLMALMQGTGFRWMISDRSYSLATRARAALSIFLSGLDHQQENPS